MENCKKKPHPAIIISRKVFSIFMLKFCLYLLVSVVIIVNFCCLFPLRISMPMSGHKKVYPIFFYYHYWFLFL